MVSLIKKLTLFLIFLLLLISLSSVYANPPKYETLDFTLCSTETYKGWPTDWWATYGIKEFDKYAPPPGADWVFADDKGYFRPNVWDFVDQAAKNGWVIKYDPRDAMVGAMAIKYNHENGKCIIYNVEEVNFNNIVVSYVLNGYPTKREITYNQLGREYMGFSFLGYIWPTKDESSINKEFNNNDGISIVPSVIK